MFFVISLIFSFCFSVMMILVIVELIVLEFIVVVNDLLIFSMLGCNVLSQENELLLVLKLLIVSLMFL